MSILFQKANLSDKSLNLTNFNRMVDYLGRLANMTSPNMMIDKGPSGYVLKMLPSASSTTTTTMDYSVFAFGFSISSNVVTVNSGRILHGTYPPLTVVGTTFTVLQDHTWIYVRYVLSGLAEILYGTDEPVFSRDELHWGLYKARVTNGVVTIGGGDIHWLGDIVIPGVFARK
jgi:hypothetical protein